MYELYIANKNYSSWSLRPWVLMRALGIPFDETLVPFLGGVGANWDAFRAFSPTGKVPCLRDGDAVVWDSLAIAEYLAERHAGVWPADPRARAWARCAAAEMHSGFPGLRSVCTMNCGVRSAARAAEDWRSGRAALGAGDGAGAAGARRSSRVAGTRRTSAPMAIHNMALRQP